MRGEVTNLQAATGSGVITGADGAAYNFDARDVRGVLSVGQAVEFDAFEGRAVAVQPLGGPAYASAGHGGVYDFQYAMFNMQGRLRRSHFWISWAILYVVGFIVGLIPFVGIIAALVLIWPNLAIAVKRFHDMGRSGWLIAIPWGAQLVGVGAFFGTIGFAAISNPRALEDEAMAGALFGVPFLVLGLCLLISLGFWLWLGIQDSEPRANRFGPNPKDPTSGTVDVFN